ncbi:MAG: ABC transporter ATP-binding protein [Acidobacteriota bacterium]|nr:ABC transporter ATP-binding protein [Acidobacteriota bacterium]
MIVLPEATREEPTGRSGRLTTATPTPVARLDAVTKTYGPVTALREVRLTVPAGGVLALLGPNGAGKTTAVKLLLGLAQPTKGRVSVFGADPRSAASRTRTGVMLQTGGVPPTLRVREHLDLFSSYYPNPLPVGECVAAAGLEGLEKRKFGELSGGQKQRLLFALALCGNPDLLFLDEPTTGLDVEARRVFWDQIKRLVRHGKTILLTTHYMEEADALADRIVVLNQGSIIAEDTPAQIKTRASGRRIRCVTRLATEELRKLSGALEVIRPCQDAQPGAVEIRAVDAEAVLRQLLALDPQLAEIEITKPRLEEAFLTLTRADDDSRNI